MRLPWDEDTQEFSRIPLHCFTDELPLEGLRPDEDAHHLHSSPDNLSSVTTTSSRWVSKRLFKVDRCRQRFQLAAVELYPFEVQTFLEPRRDLGDDRDINESERLGSRH